MEINEEMLSPSESQENTGKDELVYDAREVIDGVTVYKVYRKDGPDLWECLLQAMGKM